MRFITYTCLHALMAAAMWQTALAAKPTMPKDKENSPPTQARSWTNIDSELGQLGWTKLVSDQPNNERCSKQAISTGSRGRKHLLVPASAMEGAGRAAEPPGERPTTWAKDLKATEFAIFFLDEADPAGPLAAVRMDSQSEDEKHLKELSALVAAKEKAGRMARPRAHVALSPVSHLNLGNGGGHMKEFAGSLARLVGHLLGQDAAFRGPVGFAYRPVPPPAMASKKAFVLPDGTFCTGALAYKFPDAAADTPGQGSAASAAGAATTPDATAATTPDAGEASTARIRSSMKLHRIIDP